MGEGSVTMVAVCRSEAFADDGGLEDAFAGVLVQPKIHAGVYMMQLVQNLVHPCPSGHRWHCLP